MFSSSPIPSPSELLSKHFPHHDRHRGGGDRGTSTSSFVKASSLVSHQSARNIQIVPLDHDKAKSNDESRRSIPVPLWKDPSFSRSTKEAPIEVVDTESTNNGSKIRNTKEQLGAKIPVEGQSRIANKVVKRKEKPTPNHFGDKADGLKKSAELPAISKRSSAKAMGKKTPEIIELEKACSSGHEAVVVDINIKTQRSEPNEVTRIVGPLSPLQLQDALKRRKGWTPPPEAEPIPSPTHENAVTSPLKDPDTPFQSIGNLLSNFGCAFGSPVDFLASKIDDGIITKRRKVDLVQTGHGPPMKAVKQSREKAPKRKQPTITAKATAAFAPEESPQADSLTQYFSLLTPDSSDHTGKKSLAKQQAPDEQGRATVPKKRASTVPKSKNKKASTRRQSILLPPDEAVLSANGQDFVFGTSSQLARDHSPAMIRDIRRAIADSELDEDDTAISLKTTISSFSAQPMGKKNLWAAAARDLDNNVQGSGRRSLPDTETSPSRRPIDVNNGSRERIHGRCDTLEDHAPKLLPSGTGDLDLSDLILPRSVADASTKIRRSSTSPVKKSRKKQEVMGEMPHYDGFTQVELGKEVAKFGFKPIRKRGEMIALLQRCWDSSHRTALQNLSPNKSLHTKAGEPVLAKDSTEIKEPVKKPRQRRKKDESTDTKPTKQKKSEPATSPKPRGRPRKKPTDVGPVEEAPPATADLPEPLYQVPPQRPASSGSSKAMSTKAKASKAPKAKAKPTPALEPTTQELPSKPLYTSDLDAMFLKISEAVRAEPPTHDPTNLSFYEKILIYQPIVLEDLTTWLNTKGLATVGVDEEIPSGLVKAWCEGRSVCCLWRENLRGGTRARY